jgi:hypothetical protein
MARCILVILQVQRCIFGVFPLTDMQMLVAKLEC